MMKDPMFHTDISINLIYICVCIYIILDKRNKLDANSYIFICPHICLCVCVCVYWRRKWQPTPVFLPGESHGQRRTAWWAAVYGVAKSWT